MNKFYSIHQKDKISNKKVKFLKFSNKMILIKFLLIIKHKQII